MQWGLACLATFLKVSNSRLPAAGASSLCRCLQGQAGGWGQGTWILRKG